MLRKCDFDTCLSKSPVDFGVQFGNGPDPMIQIRKVSTQDEFEGTVAELLETGHRSRILENLRMVARNIEQNLLNSFGIAAVGDTHGDEDAVYGRRQGPVQNRTGDQILVRYNQVLSVPIRNRCGTDIDPRHGSGGPIHRHNIAHTDGTLEQQDQSAHEVGHHLLQTEAQSHT